jgi:hypothetical protein
VGGGVMVEGKAENEIKNHGRAFAVVLWMEHDDSICSLGL